MKEIARNEYLKRLMDSRDNGMIKVITGIRRCGKSYLLDPLFRRELLREGVPEDHIIKMELDWLENRKYHHDPEAFNHYLISKIQDGII